MGGLWGFYTTSEQKRTDGTYFSMPNTTPKSQGHSKIEHEMLELHLKQYKFTCCQIYRGEVNEGENILLGLIAESELPS